MRAFYLNNLANAQVGQKLSIEGEGFNHIKVVRLKPSEEILLLTGQGDNYLARLEVLGKKSAIVEVLRYEHKPQLNALTLAIGLVKKDAFDLCLKMAVELGATTIIPLETRYSQRYELNYERANRLLIQALEQSNSAWLPKLLPVTAIESLSQEIVDNCEKYSNLIIMGMANSTLPAKLPELGTSVMGFIGPEGGFSEDEEKLLAKLPNASTIHLPTPILRAPTALAALGGVIFTKQRVLD
ncbi:MAG: hypothetical protein CME71_05455 [Halobacteriovorax sp.]|mgnify:CR=1 FL=1|nr:hypothetical protein [Halobacteriovorax sp.]